ncbi:hypothetical protein P8452_61543 [Trifolium repens]|nr:hypothetical protein P8452_61543 [Trifolium repens]
MQHSNFISQNSYSLFFQVHLLSAITPTQTKLFSLLPSSSSLLLTAITPFEVLLCKVSHRRLNRKNL